ncbi:alpha/beta hydrolase family protein [Sphingomonas morindae]|uniref:Alpha/beta fold hydrolase n=1 Tax=Sphingomonas morindae TaxID=1541170 RepID=A0ABY4X3X6_9SPHN|nr:alpha/beta fold hydrolase [Sphingomonas morindae]USI71583.1 alpha/beta fold hydrolase [Sphingomonas morindae]
MPVFSSAMCQTDESPLADGQPITLCCADGVLLEGHLWTARSAAAAAVIINGATGVRARYYHRYARFLSAHGFDVLTYDYRGIGASRPPRLRGCGYRWRDWGEQDVEAALQTMLTRRSDTPVMVVGHSIGGFLPGLAPSAGRIARMLTVGAQYAWWGDYRRDARARLFLKWHVTMPVLTAVFGYFPGRRLGWLEDLPAGVALEWSFRRSRFERSYPARERLLLLKRMESVTAPILAVTVSDDDIGSPAAIRRTLNYYHAADRMAVVLHPADLNRKTIGHFSLFHDSHVDRFWPDTLRWLQAGDNPWAALRSTVTTAEQSLR